MKLLIFIAVALAFVWFVLLRPSVKRKSQDSSSQKSLKDELMLECETCGSFISQNDALTQGGKVFCSKECMERS